MRYSARGKIIVVLCAMAIVLAIYFAFFYGQPGALPKLPKDETASSTENATSIPGETPETPSDGASTTPTGFGQTTPNPHNRNDSALGKTNVSGSTEGTSTGSGGDSGQATGAIEPERSEKSPGEKISAEDREILENSGLERVHANIFFSTTLTDDIKKGLEEFGVKFIYATTISFPIDQLKNVLYNPYVNKVRYITPESKVSIALLDIMGGKQIPPEYMLSDKGKYLLIVGFYSDVSLYDAREKLLEHGVHIIYEPQSNLYYWRIELDKDSVIPLLSEDIVSEVFENPPPGIPDNDGSRELSRVNEIQNPPYSLKGFGINVGVWDYNYIYKDHPDFGGRVQVIEEFPLSNKNDPFYDHATHVTGTLGGDGNLSERYNGTKLQRRGMAPFVNIYFYSYTGSALPSNEVMQSVGDYKIMISQNSWGYLIDDSICPQYGDYAGESKTYDSIVKDNKTVIVFAAGNERGRAICNNSIRNYSTLHGPGATAKNTIVVGNFDIGKNTIDSTSSFGPTDDGRIKPDIVALGSGSDHLGRHVNSTVTNDSNTSAYPYDVMSGTSMATPAVSGVGALLMEFYKRIFGNDKNMLPSTAKAILLHSAKDLGSNGPDYRYGFGKLDASSAIDVISRNNFLEDSLSSTGKFKGYPMIVPNNGSSLKATLAWDDSINKTLDTEPQENPKLINDLDLRLIDPDGNVYYPWVLDSNPNETARRDIAAGDHLNNVEQVYVDNAMAGIWTINVSAYNLTEPQKFSLVGDYLGYLFEDNCSKLNLSIWQCRGN